MSASITHDFTIVSNTPIKGVALIMPLNEDAYSYITDELDYASLEDGSVPLWIDRIGDFMSDAASAHMSCAYC